MTLFQVKINIADELSAQEMLNNFLKNKISSEVCDNILHVGLQCTCMHKHSLYVGGSEVIGHLNVLISVLRSSSFS